MRGRPGRRLIGVLLILVVLVVGSVVTALATSVVERAHQQLSEQVMAQAMDESADAVDKQGRYYANAMQDVAAALGTGSTELSARTFAGITIPLNAERLPGASSVSFVVPAKDSQVSQTEAYWRARGAPQLTLDRSGSNSDHKFVVFSRSFTSLPPSPGRDLGATSNTSQALDTARRDWVFAMGEAHVARRDLQLPPAERQLSVTLAVPVLASNGTFLGWVVMGVHTGDFLRATLSARTRDAVNMQLVDVETKPSRTIVEINAGPRMDKRALDRSRELYVGQRLWRLDLQPTTTLLSNADRRLIQFTPLVGVAFTLLLAVLVGVLSSGRNRAMDRVDRATVALRHDIERRQGVEKELRERESELHELAFHDQLTGLANRGLFYDRVALALSTHAGTSSMFAVFFIDLDGFKEVNDRYGHGAGDLVLKAAASRLQDCIRRDSDTVARFGGDEFAVLVERLNSPDFVHVAAARMVAALRAPIRVGDDDETTVTASIGIALSRSGDTADAILHAADVAMYEAKTTGKSRHVLSNS